MMWQYVSVCLHVLHLSELNKWRHDEEDKKKIIDK